MRLAGVADLSIDRVHQAFQRTSYPSMRIDESRRLSLAQGIRQNKTVATTDSTELIAQPEIDIILEATGDPTAGVRHALLCCEHKKHIVMINVEADVLAGPLLARKAKEAGILYSWAYGDQPALIAELVDWARTSGFQVVCAGKGNKFLPEYNYSTPDTVWDHWGLSEDQLKEDSLNAKLYNSFLDGTKSALEMAAVANGCGLSCPPSGLRFPPCGYHDMAEMLKPKSHGGQSEVYGTVEVTSSLERDGRAVHNHARMGVFVVIEATSDYQKINFEHYGLETDSSGRFATQYKPWHLVGLEVGVTVASIMCRGEPTGSTKTFSGDVIASAKRDIKAGEILDGEGGYAVLGKLVPAERSLEIRGLPAGLAVNLKMKCDVKKDQLLSWEDVEIPQKPSDVLSLRLEMEAIFREEFAARRKKLYNGLLSANGFH